MFEDALKRCVSKLHKVKSDDWIDDFAIIGGFAVSCWGIPRATADIDCIIKLGTNRPETFAKQIGGTYRKGDLKDPLRGSISYEEATDDGFVPVQLLLFPPAWENIGFEKLHLMDMDKIRIPFVSWQSLVLLKLYGGSALDLEDARGILSLQKPSSKVINDLKKKASALRISRRLARILS